MKRKKICIFPQMSIGEARPEWQMDLRQYTVPAGAVRARLSVQLLNSVGVWDIPQVAMRFKP